MSFAEMPFEEVLFGQLSVGEMSDRGIVCLGNCRWESVCRGMSVRVMFVWEMTSGNYPSEKYPSRNCSSGKFQFGELSVCGTVVTNLLVGRNVRRGNDFGELSVAEISVEELSVGETP